MNRKNWLQTATFVIIVIVAVAMSQIVSGVWGIVLSAVVGVSIGAGAQFMIRRLENP